MKTELTIEQSQRLIELGVDANKASKEIAVTISEQEYSDPCHPIFTLADLLGILPSDVSPQADVYTLQIYYDIYRHKWIAEYRTLGLRIKMHSIAEKELIDALYELTIWLIENKYLQQ